MVQFNHIDHSEFEGETTRRVPVISPDDARQGVISGRVSLILVSSLMMTLLAFAILYAVYT